MPVYLMNIALIFFGLFFSFILNRLYARKNILHIGMYSVGAAFRTQRNRCRR